MDAGANPNAHDVSRTCGRTILNAACMIVGCKFTMSVKNTDEASLKADREFWGGGCSNSCGYSRAQGFKRVQQ